MGSSRPPERSLASGISFSQWMKGKMDSRFDFDQSTFSPPSHDDNFFYLNYPKSIHSPNENQQKGFKSLNAVINEKGINDNSVSSGSDAQITKVERVERIDFSKHPLPCQPFIPLNDIKGQEKVTLTFGSKSINKSQGIDDGFHSEPARCGKSIVHVANRIMSGALGSKSLPVSPITSPISTPDTSPKSRRRAQGNRFFSGAFIPDRDKNQGGWLLSSILNQSREIIGNKIDEENEAVEIVKPKTLSRKKSISSQNLSYLGNEKIIDEKADISSHSIAFQTESSEYREMNFWSPTSM